MNHPITSRKAFWLGLIALAILTPLSAKAQQVVSISAGDSAGLQQAINASSDGTIIELASGTYSAPSGAFNIYAVTTNTRSITIRAAAGANVSLTGSGGDIIRFTDPNCTVHFERLTFANGTSNQNAIGGALTLVNVKAVFTSCVFDNNSANGPTGGGAQWIDANSVIYFNSCTWTKNTSQRFGGAASIGRDSRVFLRNCRFSGNRSDVNGSSHIPNSDGGALHISNSIVRVDNCSFDNNATGYTGGALSVIGDWDRATTEVTINNSSFTNNSASQPRTNAFNTPTFAGAIHAEAMTTLRLNNCRFTGNSAQQGGALGLYLSLAEIAGCIFKDNQTSGSGADESQGGTIAALSAESPGSQHRPAQLIVRDSLFQSTTNAAIGRQGGFIFIAGDLGAAYGIFGQTQNGSVESNRSPFSITRCAFVGGSVQGAGGIGGDGGAIEAIFVNATIQDSIFTNCSASNSAGGTMFVNNSVANITGSTFTHCSAGRGAAFNMFGGTLTISGCSFARNVGSNNDAAGSVFLTGYALPDIGLPAFDMNGSISNSTFSDNVGKFVIYDSDRGDSLANRFQYSANKFFPDRPDLFWSDVVGAKDVAGLNALVVSHSDGTTVKKAPTANTALASAPVLGAVLLIPTTIQTQGAPGDTLPLPSFIVFASAGGNVSLDGASQGSDAGVVAATTDTAHTLTVGSTSFPTTPVLGAAVNISTRLAVGQDDNALIGGIIVVGPTPKRVIIRAVGPSIPNVSGTLQNPRLELHDASGATIATNDNWRATELGPVITTSQSIDIEATTVAPASTAEPAIVATLDPSPARYTAVVRGVNNTTGIALVEVYDLETALPSRLANISTRGFIPAGTDNVMIGGFIFAGGPGATNVVVRGIGPSLSKSGVTNPLADPVLELHDVNGALVVANDDWRSTANVAALQANNLAPSNDAESAIFKTDLARGNYTAILKGKNGGTGVGLVEVYVF